MFSKSEIRGYAQDAVIRLLEDSQDPDANLVYTGQFVVVGSISSTWPWNVDNVYKRSFAAQEPVLAVYIDCSVPGAGFGLWAARDSGGSWRYSEDLSGLLEELGRSL